MSGIKPGDRVRIESFEVTVTRVDDNSAGESVVWFSDGDDTSPVGVATACVVLSGRCTVIVPPVKVGDTVTADNIGQLPPGSVIAHPLSQAWTLDIAGKWCRHGTSPADGDSFCTGAYVVLRIGDAS